MSSFDRPDVIKTTDKVTELSPEDDEAGGRIVAPGTSADVAAVPASFTGTCLAPLIGVPRAKASRGTAGLPPFGRPSSRWGPPPDPMCAEGAV
jgi:excinuclease ABC subunit A